MNQLSDDNIPLRSHTKKKKLTKLIQKKQKQEIDIKPFGLWYAYKNDWLKNFILANNWLEGYNEQSYMYEIQFKHGIFTRSLLEIKKGKILKISSKNDLTNFHNKYKVAIEKHVYINWKNVSKDFSGIEFVPFKYVPPPSVRYRRNPLLWYNTVDVASGCIWDNSVFKKISLTHTFKVTKNEKFLYNKLKNNENIEIEILTKK